MPEFAFVTTDSSARIRGADRQLIRRHCMQRKNKQPTSRRSRREAAVAAAASSGQLKKTRPKSSPEPQTDPAEKSRGSRSDSCTGDIQYRSRSGQPDILPPPPPSDWALFHFPDELGLSAQEMMHQYFIHNPIKDLLCPFGLFGLEIEFPDDSAWYFNIITTERLILRSTLLLASAANDLVLKQPLSNETRKHLQSTLPLLNERLCSDDDDRHQISLFAIAILAAVAVIFGDFNAAKTHALGISKIIRLNGGLRRISLKPIVQLSIDRLNFSSMLITRQWTPIYSSSAWDMPAFPAAIRHLHHLENMLSVADMVAPDIATVFAHLQNITILFNRHFYAQTPMEGRFVQQCLGFSHCKLIELEVQEDEVSECLRLSMLALFATTFRLPGNYTHPCFMSLASRLERSYAAVRLSHSALNPTLDIWFMFVCLITFGNVPEHHTWANFKASGAANMSWSEIRQDIKRVLWIDTFHDDLGKRAYDILTDQFTPIPYEPCIVYNEEV